MPIYPRAAKYIFWLIHGFNARHDPSPGDIGTHRIFGADVCNSWLLGIGASLMIDGIGRNIRRRRRRRCAEKAAKAAAVEAAQD